MERKDIAKRHLQLAVPTIKGEAYATRYARLLKRFTKSILTEATKIAISEFKKHSIKPTSDKKRKRTTDAEYSSPLNYAFDEYDQKATEFASEFTKEELEHLYRFVSGRYKQAFPNISVSSEYYKNIMGAVSNENLALIRSIPNEILKEFQVVLSQSIVSLNAKELIKNLKRKYKTYENLIKFFKIKVGVRTHE